MNNAPTTQISTTSPAASTALSEPHAKKPGDSAQSSRFRFGQELDICVRDWAQWIGRRRNRKTWTAWTEQHPSLVAVDPTGATRLHLDDDAAAIHALMTLARTDPSATMALLALLAPVWMHKKSRYLSLELSEIAAAIHAENLDVPSCRTAPVRAIIRRATRQSDRAYWVRTHDQPSRCDLSPILATKPSPGDFVETLVTTTVIESTVQPGSCLHLRMAGRTPGEINRVIGSPKKARTRTLRERAVLARRLELTHLTKAA